MVYLDLRQVLLDYALLAGHVMQELSGGGDTKKDPVYGSVPVIAYGAGYSGSLATWLRLHHGRSVITGWVRGVNR